MHIRVLSDSAAEAVVADAACYFSYSLFQWLNYSYYVR